MTTMKLEPAVRTCQACGKRLPEARSARCANCGAVQHKSTCPAMSASTGPINPFTRHDGREMHGRLLD